LSSSGVIVTITAGGRVTGPFAQAIGTEVKALAVTHGRSLLDAALEAARALSPSRIFVVGGSAVRSRCPSDVEVLDESNAGAGNIRRALGTGATEPLLLLTSDTPFVDAAALNDFVTRARGYDIALPLAAADAYERAYPGAPPHAVRLGPERVVNGSAIFLGPGVGPRISDTATRLFDARKSLLRMASLLGPALLARFAIGRLRIAHVEARAQTVLGLSARAIRDAAPSLCFDIDTLDDYRYAQARSGAS
jgi:GTP:adenosylcobinamide-phosphate guanylyltransferase